MAQAGNDLSKIIPPEFLHVSKKATIHHQQQPFQCHGLKPFLVLCHPDEGTAGHQEFVPTAAGAAQEQPTGADPGFPPVRRGPVPVPQWLPVLRAAVQPLSSTRAAHLTSQPL